MNTTELVAKGVSKVQAKSIVDDIFKDIVDAAASGAEVSLPGFGKFKVKAAPHSRRSAKPLHRAPRPPLSRTRLLGFSSPNMPAS